MREVIGKILSYGDIHLNSKNYGAHRNYPAESLEYFRIITDKAEELNATHIIGTGDFTYSRFHTLEYRREVERQLTKQYEITNGNRYEIKGNHDSATYGMTEYEYYVSKGLIKPSTNFKLGVLNISMVDYGKHEVVDIIEPSKNTISVVFAHDYFKFSDSNLPDYGNAIILDNMTRWFGVDYIICGHIHNYELFKGIIIKDGTAYDTVVTYLGCMSRPAYREGFMQDVGKILLLTVYNDDTVEVEFIDIPLWELNKSFNIEQRQKDIERKEFRHVDISDIVNKLDKHERVIGNPEDIIMSIPNVKMEYKMRAIELLKYAQE